MEKFILDAGQQAAVAAITSPKRRGALLALTGSAGTGKTTCVARIAANWDGPVLRTGTTHKSAAVLGKGAGTVHSRLNLRLTRVEGKEILVAGEKRPEFTRDTLLICDEASMVDDVLFGHIQSAGVTTLFVGDPCQLPPVGDDPELFEREDVKRWHLDKVHRQGAGNPILKQATEWRDHIEGPSDEEPRLRHEVNAAGDGVYLVGADEFRARVREGALNGRIGAMDKVVVWRNTVALAWNKLASKAVYNDDDLVHAGQHVVAGRLVRRDGVTLINTDGTVKLETCVPGTSSHGVAGWHVGYGDVKLFVPRSMTEARVAVAPLRAHALKQTDAFKRSAAWREFYAAYDEYTDLRPSWACTTHKAQGSTFENVYIDLRDLDGCNLPERAKLFYTAITRASKRVFFNMGDATC